MATAQAPAETREAFTSAGLRAALGAFATGVTVVTSRGEAHCYGMTASAFSSVSLDPPFVLVCVKAGGAGCDHIERNRCFAINILGEHQEPLSRYFSSKDRPRGRDAFRDVAHRTAATGSPILDAVAGYLDCSLHAVHTAGDHKIFIGEVLSLGVNSDVRPLIFHGGAYAVIDRP
jgi:3-hydroxy-9,10-secoandrosta-1,3,5(10)-triene-9,17-dione monooxygenase reductase component